MPELDCTKMSPSQFFLALKRAARCGRVEYYTTLTVATSSNVRMNGPTREERDQSARDQ